VGSHVDEGFRNCGKQVKRRVEGDEEDTIAEYRILFSKEG